MSDKIDASFEMLARQFGTHVIRDPLLLAAKGVDVTQLIVKPEITFTAVLSDGTLLLRCPAELPEHLKAAAEPLDPPIAIARITLDDRLALIERKLDGIIAEQMERERIVDRIESMEFALRERLDREFEEATVLETLINKHDEVLQALAYIGTQDIAQSFNALGHTLVGTVQTTLSSGVSAIRADIEGAAGQLKALSDRTGPLSRVIRRMALDPVEASGQPMVNLPQLDSISEHFDRMATQFDSLAASVQRLDAHVIALDQRPDPILDLTPQRQSFATFATVMAKVVARLEAVSNGLDMQTQATTLADQLVERLKNVQAELRHGSTEQPDQRNLMAELPLQAPDHVSPQTPTPRLAEEASNALFRVARDELLLDLRFAFAELIAMYLYAKGQAA